MKFPTPLLTSKSHAALSSVFLIISGEYFVDFGPDPAFGGTNADQA